MFHGVSIFELITNVGEKEIKKEKRKMKKKEAENCRIRQYLLSEQRKSRALTFVPCALMGVQPRNRDT